MPPAPTVMGTRGHFTPRFNQGAGVRYFFKFRSEPCRTGITHESEGDMKMKFDWITALLVTVLIATLIAFSTGVFPYPYGWIVVSLMLMFRLSARRQKD